MLRKHSMAALAGALLLGLMIPQASAVMKASADCAKLGQTSTISGTKYTCVQLGKKTVWVALSAPKEPGWVPTGFHVYTTLNKDVAYKWVPTSQLGNCRWCSARHGQWYSKADFIAKSGCSNLYVDSVVLNSSGVQVGKWYQKGGYVAAMQPIRLEFVTSEKNQTFKITTIYC